jgi:hypothetical protein
MPSTGRRSPSASSSTAAQRELKSVWKDGTRAI